MYWPIRWIMKGAALLVAGAIGYGIGKSKQEKKEEQDD